MRAFIVGIFRVLRTQKVSAFYAVITSGYCQNQIEECNNLYGLSGYATE